MRGIVVGKQVTYEGIKTKGKKNLYWKMTISDKVITMAAWCAIENDTKWPKSVDANDYVEAEIINIYLVCASEKNLKKGSDLLDGAFHEIKEKVGILDAREVIEYCNCKEKFKSIDRLLNK